MRVVAVEAIRISGPDTVSSNDTGNLIYARHRECLVADLPFHAPIRPFHDGSAIGVGGNLYALHVIHFNNLDFLRKDISALFPVGPDLLTLHRPSNLPRSEG